MSNLRLTVSIPRTSEPNQRHMPWHADPNLHRVRSTAQAFNYPATLSLCFEADPASADKKIPGFSKRKPGIEIYCYLGNSLITNSTWSLPESFR